MSNFVVPSNDVEVASPSSWPLGVQRIPITEYIAPSVPQASSHSPRSNIVCLDGSSSPNQLDDAFSIIDEEAGITPGEELANLHDNERTRFMKELFEGPATCQCCVNWVADCPPDLEETNPLESERDDEESFTVRRRRTYGGSKTWEIHSIEVNSKPLRAVLLKVFEGFDGLVLGLKYLRFLAPFRSFYWRWDRFEKAISEHHDENLTKPLKALHRLVKSSFAKAFQTTKELLSHGVIGHSYLWALFKPGELIYSNEDGHDRFYVLHSILEYPGIEFDLCCKYVDYDGFKFGYAEKRIQIMGFSETVSITKLKAFPAKYLDSLDRVQEKILARGQAFRNLAGVHCKSYRESAHAKVDRRIIVDAQSHPDKLALGGISDSIVLSSGGLIQQSPLVYAVPSGGHIQLDRETDTNIYPGPSYRLHEPNPSMPYPPGRMPPGGYPPPPPGGYPPGVKAMMRKSKTKKRGAYDSRIPPLPPPPPAELSFGDLLGQEPFTGSGLKKAVPNPGTLSETDLLICSPKVRGFCLQDKMWRIFDVECIDDVDWDIHAFDSLVLPEGYKDLILAFVDSQLKRGDSFDDVINGKGGGLIIMLSGKPGVGKTLSAESCAERLQLPLYKMELREDDGYISPSDCDTNQASYNATNTRASIERQFELVTKWNAVLLVDECDAFLQKRSRGDPKRNEVMSTFLQKLEYYQSLIFLTTNVAESLDPAVLSRVHLTINYPDLDEVSRNTVWRNFLARVRPSAMVSDADIEMLGKLPLNGRRIKNAVKTAQIMANREHRGVTLDDIRKVMRITEGMTLD